LGEVRQMKQWLCHVCARPVRPGEEVATPFFASSTKKWFVVSACDACVHERYKYPLFFTTYRVDVHEKRNTGGWGSIGFDHWWTVLK